MRDIDKEKLNTFCKENNIRFVVLFGSRAKDERGEKVLIRENSDFDVAVLTEPGKDIKSSLDNYNNILFGLCNILNIPDYKMDLTNLNNADPFLKYEVCSNDVLLYGDEGQYRSFKLLAIREYLDMNDLHAFQHSMILRRQKLLTEKIYA